MSNEYRLISGGITLLQALQKTPSLLGAECQGVGTTPLHANERGQTVRFVAVIEPPVYWGISILNYASGAGAGCDETFYAEYIPQNTNVDYIFSGLEPHCGRTLKRPVTIDHTNYILTVMEDRPKKLYRLYKDTEGKKQKELICNFEAVPKYY